jgi:hypothetical protein
MSDFLTSTQSNQWMMQSLDAFREHAKKTQKNIASKIDKYAKPRSGEKPINEVVNYNFQQHLLAYCIHELYFTYGGAKLNLPPKILVIIHQLL